MTGLQFLSNLERVLQLYRHYNLHDGVKRVLLYIQQLSIGTNSELESVAYEFEIPQEFSELAGTVFDKVAKTDEERLNNFADYFLPKKAKAEANLKKMQKKRLCDIFLRRNLKMRKGDQHL